MHAVTLSHFVDRFHQTGFDSAHMQGVVWAQGSTAGVHHKRPSDLGRTARRATAASESAALSLSGPLCTLKAAHLPSIQGRVASSFISPGIGDHKHQWISTHRFH